MSDDGNRHVQSKRRNVGKEIKWNNEHTVRKRCMKENTYSVRISVERDIVDRRFLIDHSWRAARKSRSSLWLVLKHFTRCSATVVGLGDAPPSTTGSFLRFSLSVSSLSVSFSFFLSLAKVSTASFSSEKFRIFLLLTNLNKLRLMAGIYTRLKATRHMASRNWF